MVRQEDQLRQPGFVLGPWNPGSQGVLQAEPATILRGGPLGPAGGRAARTARPAKRKADGVSRHDFVRLLVKCWLAKVQSVAEVPCEDPAASQVSGGTGSHTRACTPAQHLYAARGLLLHPRSPGKAHSQAPTCGRHFGGAGWQVLERQLMRPAGEQRGALRNEQARERLLVCSAAS